MCALDNLGFTVCRQKPITVHYGGQVVGVLTADLVVNDFLIVELKANQLLAKAHAVQLVNYLVATGINEGLLLNFGAERLEYKKRFGCSKKNWLPSDLLEPFC